jgi:hypothetical protein
VYERYVRRHRSAAEYFIEQVRIMAQPILNDEDGSDAFANDIIFSSAILGGFTRLLSEKRICLKTPRLWKN